MINTNELRVGNWVLENGRPVQLYGVHKKDIKHFWFGNHNEVATLDILDVIEPVLLTPEILYKCGFTKIRTVWADPERFELEEIYPDKYNFVFGVRKRRLNIRYLHQLQNIYFQIVGKDLIVVLNA